MAHCKFYLKTPEPTTGLSLIYLRFTYGGKKFAFAFGQNVDPKDWNKKKQRLKKNTQTTADGKHALNDLLDNLERVCFETYNKELANGFPNGAVIKEALERFMSGGEDANFDFYTLCEKIMKNEIKFKGKDRTVNTIKAYKTTINHLKEFEKKTKYRIAFDTITLDFHNRFVSFLTSQDLIPNSIGKDIKNIRSIMSIAIDMKLTANTDFKSIRFAKPVNATDAVSLTENEVRQLYEFNFNNKRLEEIRDMFIFQCSTGLRWSDLRSLEAKNIIDRDGWKFVLLRSKKTNEYSEIPCSEYGIAILNKYRQNCNALPNVRSDQEYNRMIKEACRIAGLTAKSRLNTDLSKQLWECIASHTARRTCFTLLYKSGFPIVELMRISGHKSMQSLMGYLKISAADAADKLRKHYEKRVENDATSLLKAV